jgi:small-conductance mechanosensitive channel
LCYVPTHRVPYSSTALDPIDWAAIGLVVLLLGGFLLAFLLYFRTAFKQGGWKNVRRSAWFALVALTGFVIERVLENHRIASLKSFIQHLCVPRQMPTIIGFATAGLTVVFQDFILAFCGWFVLMGRNGIRARDWVEIEGVFGEVVQLGLFRTWLLETGNWTAHGHPTGRKISFLNSYAIRGKYFNFSTVGQWMWDEIKVTIPPGAEIHPLIKKIYEDLVKVTEADAKMAEAEWKRVTHEEGSPQFSAMPSVNLRPAGAGVDVVIRYITGAGVRVETRNRLYAMIVELIQGVDSGVISDKAIYSNA